MSGPYENQNRHNYMHTSERRTTLSKTSSVGSHVFFSIGRFYVKYTNKTFRVYKLGGQS